MLWTLPGRCFVVLIFTLILMAVAIYVMILKLLNNIFSQQKMQDWISDLKKLNTIAESQHYTVCSHGLSFW